MNISSRTRIAVIAAISAVIAFISGWAIGTASTCGQLCGFDTALFEALGTWLGAIATFLVAGVGGMFTYRWRMVERRDKIDARAKAERVESQAALVAARKCPVRVAPKPQGGNKWGSIEVTFFNKLEEDVTELSMHYRGVEFKSAAQVNEKRDFSGDFDFDFGADRTRTEEVAGAVIWSQAMPHVEVRYTVRGYRFKRRGADVSPL